MAQGVVKKRILEIFFILIIIIIFFTLGNKYATSNTSSHLKINDFFVTIKGKLTEKFTPQEKIVCKNNKIKISVSGGDLCREEVESQEYKYLEIFDTYPKSIKGQEIIYDFLDEGDIAIADAYLNDKIEIQRYEAINLSEVSWEEDPYNERYWRFIFYSLQNTKHLLYAYQETGEEKYKDKLVEVIEDFIDNGINKEHAWDDYHGVAFRTMTLVNTWWKLREQNALSVEVSEKILISLERHGKFLCDERHYEASHNHGISQMAALLVLSKAFPNIDGADKWLEIAGLRLNRGIKDLVDDDGVLVENSPYYHFYALKKYWQILGYALDNDIQVDESFLRTIEKMISYATYIVQPNSELPLLGASLKRVVGNSGVFKEIAREYPTFLYTITQGQKGKKPSELNKYYSTTGQVIMRSDWGKKTKLENSFKKQTQIIFDVGPYRTEHSDLDALSFNLYSNGKTLLTDTGLYTYEDTKLKKYFHGTRGHNTVLVDGEDQKTGLPVPGTFKEEGDIVVHSAHHSLYPQTIHERAIVLLEHDLVFIIDRMISEKEHSYEQLFHLSPGAKVENTRTAVTATWGGKDEKLIIRQLSPNGITLSSVIGDEETGNGFCSFEYEKKVPCEMLSYQKQAANTDYVTLLEIGNNNRYVSSQIIGDTIIIRTDNKVYDINLNNLDVDFLEESFLREKVINRYDFNLSLQDGQWLLSGEGSDKFKIESKDNKLAIIPKNKDVASNIVDRPYYVVEIDGVTSYYSIEQEIFTDVPIDLEQELFRIYEQEDFLPILGYHHIRSDNYEIKKPTLEMHISDFEAQIDYLTNKMGCRWFTFGDIIENYVLKNKKTPKRACVMNFDDGRRNHFVNAFKIFKKYGAVATFYIIIQDNLDNKIISMNINQINQLFKNGNEIGSHTVDSRGLLTGGHDYDDLVHQLRDSKKMLQAEGYKVTTFAYPRGEDNQEIVDLAKEFYIAGRDISKNNTWRDRRSSTISFDKDYIWHMHYHKPELETPEELEKVIGYNTWWQFEEGYEINRTNGNSVRNFSSIDPTDTSFGVVSLGNVGNKISNKFIISKDAEYVLEVFGSVNTRNSFGYAMLPTVNIYIDDVKQILRKGDTTECIPYKKQHFCSYDVTAYLNEGEHVISVEATQQNVKVDKFRMYQPKKLENTYNVRMTEFKRILPRENPFQVKMNIGVSRKIPLFVWILLPFVFFSLVYFNLKKR